MVYAGVSRAPTSLRPVLFSVKTGPPILEINVGDLETLLGDNQYYWLLVIGAARVNRMLKEPQVVGHASELARRRRA